jgi:hypothetical protein
VHRPNHLIERCSQPSRQQHRRGSGGVFTNGTGTDVSRREAVSAILAMIDRDLIPGRRFMLIYLVQLCLSFTLLQLTEQGVPASACDSWWVGFYPIDGGATEQFTGTG